jgi:hypothetical protein
MSFPFETTVSALAANLGRYEIAYLPDDGWLVAGIDTVNDRRNAVKWLPVEEVGPGELKTIIADGLRFGPFAAGRQIVLRRVEVQS